MLKKIQVVVTTTYEYEPDLHGEYYGEHEAYNLYSAMELDKKDVEKGEITLDELAGDPSIVDRKWTMV